MSLAAPLPAVRGVVRLALVLTALLGACSEPEVQEVGSAADAVAFGSAPLQIVAGTDTLTIQVELATTAVQRAQGLMERTRLGEDEGMLFTYPQAQPGESGFWMFRTRIPLDIAFLDEEGRIVAVESMEPCASPDPRWCPSYAPGVPYVAALEVNPGFLERHEIELGDRVLLPAR